MSDQVTRQQRPSGAFACRLRRIGESAMRRAHNAVDVYGMVRRSKSSHPAGVAQI